MGWFSSDHPGHEGYVVGLVPRSEWAWRELTTGDDGEHPLRMIAVGCDCGWRSPRLYAPPGTRWSPYIVDLPTKTDDERAYRIWWHGHIENAGEVEPAPTLREEADRIHEVAYPLAERMAVRR
ncbi:MAG: hypothetical protein JO086_00135 [Acidimicrobiia bacterium]|nr:hypothetical protein [Acidimicrobiia bacterium]